MNLTHFSDPFLPVRAADPADIHCPTCQKLIFDGEVLLARVTKFGPAGAEACCKICKTSVPVPVAVTAGTRR